MAILVYRSVPYLSRVIFRVRNGAKQHPSLATKMAAAWIVDRQDRIYLNVVLTTFIWGVLPKHLKHLKPSGKQSGGSAGT